MRDTGTLDDVMRLVGRVARRNAVRGDLDAVTDAVRAHVEAHGGVCECLAGTPRGNPAPVASTAAQKASRGPAPHTVVDPREQARICRVCLYVRPVTEFARTKNGTRGRRNACRSCENIRKRVSRTADREAR